MQDPINHLLNALYTASSAKIATVSIRYSKISERILNIFADEGFILNVSNQVRALIVDLNQNFPIRLLVQCSKPGNPSYISYTNLRRYPWAIVSTRDSLLVWPKYYRGKTKGGLILIGMNQLR